VSPKEEGTSDHQTADEEVKSLVSAWRVNFEISGFIKLRPHKDSLGLRAGQNPLWLVMNGTERLFQRIPKAPKDKRHRYKLINRCHQNPFIGALGIQEPVMPGEPLIEPKGIMSCVS
jgi:hypothetical protein